MSSSNQSQSLAAVLADFKAKVKIAVKRLEEFLQQRSLSAFKETETALRTILDALPSAVASAGAPQIAKSLIPLAEASAQLTPQWASPSGGTYFYNPLAAIGFYAVTFGKTYSSVLGKLLLEGGASIPFEQLKTLLAPLRLIPLGVASIEKAWKQFEAAFEGQSGSTVMEAKDTVTYLRCGIINSFSALIIATLIFRNDGGVIAHNLDKLKAAGLDYWSNREQWKLLNSLVVIMSSRAYNHPCFGQDETSDEKELAAGTKKEYLQYFEGLGAVIEVENKFLDLGISHLQMLELKHEMFYSKKHVLCFVMALEALALHAADWLDKTDSNLDYLYHVMRIFVRTLCAHTKEEAAPFSEALEWALSPEVHQRVFDACTVIYEAALKCDESNVRRSRGLMIVCSVLAVWRVRWDLVNHESTQLPADAEIVFLKSDILMGNAWNTVMEYFLQGNRLQTQLPLMALSFWIDSHFKLASKYNPYASLKMDASWLAVDSSGEMPKLKLRYEHLETLLNISLTSSLLTKNGHFDDFSGTISVLPQTAILSVLQTIAAAGGMMHEESARIKAWKYAKPCVISALKAAKAFVSVPFSKWLVLYENPDARAEASAKEFVAEITGFTMTVLGIPFNIRVLASSAEDQFKKDLAAIALMTLDIFEAMSADTKSALAKTPFLLPCYPPFFRSSSILSNILPADQYMASLKSLLELVGVFREECGTERLEDKEEALISTVFSEWMKGGQDKESSAVARAELLGATLPCACFSCTTIKLAGKTKIPSKKCSGCKTVFYCSNECQKKDWKLHKVACKAIVAAKAAAAAGSAS